MNFLHFALVLATLCTNYGSSQKLGELGKFSDQLKKALAIQVGNIAELPEYCYAPYQSCAGVPYATMYIKVRGCKRICSRNPQCQSFEMRGEMGCYLRNTTCAVPRITVSRNHYYVKTAAVPYLKKSQTALQWKMLYRMVTISDFWAARDPCRLLDTVFETPPA